MGVVDVMKVEKKIHSDDVVIVKAGSCMMCMKGIL